MAPTTGKTQDMTVAAGDRLVVRAHHQGEQERDAEVLEILGGDRPHYRVRWQDDGHESTLYPGSDVFIEHFPHPSRKAAESKDS